ncbi:hypothetical protein GE107_12880 [Cohnella sp. CFH 77786]|uniref:hypothetical protein n=1 Tax=Cohnella sp. CFH 77786 TaxID=2662265 RepID=UPI001C609F00|nr:hypothetical protein [Cohnella sp. CFH 77786]MBW5446956.1 hypothetical protein [Cohnella sp. CFH 77786]
MIGAVEAGGSEIVCGIGYEEGIFAGRFRLPTEQPERRLGRVVDDPWGLGNNACLRGSLALDFRVWERSQ